MKILISNDDGYAAPGLRALAAALSPLADVTVVAPEINRSGASNSLTLDRPLNVRTADNGFLYVDGTPTDCVHIALTGLLAGAPDLVVSGINDGQNMGDDTLYSGTVAAAMEGFLFGVPAIAFSLNDKRMEHLESAARVAHDIVAAFKAAPPVDPMLWNINIPDLPHASLKGWAATRLGKRHPAEPAIPSLDANGRTVYRIGPAGPAKDAGPGTDFHAVANGYVSMTPLRVDLTRDDQLDLMRQWLANQR